MKDGANESEKMMCGVQGARVFICFNYYVGTEVLFFTAHFDARAVSDPVDIFTDESNSSGSSEKMRVDGVSDAAVQGSRCLVPSESILVRDGAAGGRARCDPRFASANAGTAGPARPYASQV
ncbi:hypothetical protein [Burkholderia lata]|uniref:hypothetical protein n=1 Tax=Burkholderia lata (strain ATCC 17760 / DSM 23089 / LMG 22485 / NCIMB 9086 / R18194 / 383) TaxID=482957 RepID=UPI001583A58D|nr:hypothetical protein [Burkholderia lata]